MVKRYTKRPVTIEAMQFTGTEENWNELLEFTDEAVCNLMISKTITDMQQITTCCVPTMEGLMTATAGDYIIKVLRESFILATKRFFY